MMRGISLNIRYVGYACLVFILISLVLIQPVFGARIHGIVYDLSLEQVERAQVLLNTTPEQMMIAENGTYAFTVIPGSYTIKAMVREDGEIVSQAVENITISHDGTFRRDLILYPSFSDEEDLISPYGEHDPVKEEGITFTTEGTIPWMPITGITVALILVMSLLYSRWRPKKSRTRRRTKKVKPGQREPQTETEQLIRIIEGQGGRMTQKDLRREMPMSEAKMSLLIHEMERDGTIEKFKKGRGNIIRLKG